MRVAGIVCDDLGEISCRTNKCGAGAWRKFNVVDERTDRNGAERKSVAPRKRCVSSDDERIVNLHFFRHNDIPTLAVSIERKSDESATEGIVFNGLESCRNIFLVVREINITETTLMSAALVTRRDATESISAAAACLLL